MKHSTFNFKWLALAFQISLLSSALILDYLNLSAVEVIGMIFGVILLDRLLKAISGSHSLKWNLKQLSLRDLPLSSISLASSVIFNLRADLPFLIAASVLAVISKYVLLFRGRHFLNPSNFGIVVALLVWPSEAVTQGSRWGTTWIFPLIILGFGIPVLYLAKKLTMLVAIFIAYPLGALLLESIAGFPALANWPTMYSTGFLLAFFFMMTDPATSPQRRWTQALYAVSIVFFDQLFRALERPDSLMYAIFLTTTLIPISRLLEERMRSQKSAQS
ncbi:MAG TPA: RnfABCDGE type electron transport complex subunit D [Pseudobdellovibrionaceae bacterium]|nr:RnfABCDGE type electron transport complex subunit D [Pseudobdellovibrionaceae bacterium]